MRINTTRSRWLALVALTAFFLVAAAAAGFAADDIVLDPDGVAPFTEDSSNPGVDLGDICLDTDATGTVLIAAKNGSGQTWNNGATVTVTSAGSGGDYAADVTVGVGADNTITLPADWNALPSNTLSTDTAVGSFTVNSAVLGAHSALAQWSGTGAGGAATQSTPNLHIDWNVIDCPEPPAQATLNVVKFYDANANGINDDGQLLTGWQIGIQNSIDIVRYTPVSILLDPDDYTVTEFAPLETNWMGTTLNPAYLTLASGDDSTVEFGNLCVGAGGGLTLGFWSNKNGKALFGGGDLALMVSLNLRTADGSAFDPTNYPNFRTWLLSATATNMAYMLSAQLAAMELNVLNGTVNGGALVYAPGTSSANTLGFATVAALMAEANAELGLHGLTTDGSPHRDHQEALKNALDRANNNRNFVQSTPCPFSFAS